MGLNKLKDSFSKVRSLSRWKNLIECWYYSTYLGAYNYLEYQLRSGTVAVAKPGENSKCYADRHGAVKNGLADSDRQTE